MMKNCGTCANFAETGRQEWEPVVCTWTPKQAPNWVRPLLSINPGVFDPGDCENCPGWAPRDGVLIKFGPEGVLKANSPQQPTKENVVYQDNDTQIEYRGTEFFHVLTLKQHRQRRCVITSIDVDADVEPLLSELVSISRGTL